jgi:hypothetical protein
VKPLRRTRTQKVRSLRGSGIGLFASMSMHAPLYDLVVLRTACRMRDGRRCSCGYWLAGIAQHGPINVRPDVFAAHGAVCGALDGRATLGWHWSDSVAPLANENRGNAEPLGKVRRRPVCRNVCAKVHSPYISAALKPCQALREFTLLAPGGVAPPNGRFFAPKI